MMVKAENNKILRTAWIQTSYTIWRLCFWYILFLCVWKKIELLWWKHLPFLNDSQSREGKKEEKVSWSWAVCPAFCVLVRLSCHWMFWPGSYYCLHLDFRFHSVCIKSASLCHGNFLFYFPSPLIHECYLQFRFPRVIGLILCTCPSQLFPLVSLLLVHTVDDFLSYLLLLLVVLLLSHMPFYLSQVCLSLFLSKSSLETEFCVWFAVIQALGNNTLLSLGVLLPAGSVALLDRMI